MPLKKSVANLRYRLGIVDLIARPSRADPGSMEFLVVELKRIRLKIRMDGNKNHARAHIHVEYGTDFHAASYAVDTGERLAGRLSSKYDDEIAEWIEKRRPKLLTLWAKAREHGQDEVLLAEIRAETERDEENNRLCA
jgi:hypothetical protein